MSKIRKNNGGSMDMTTGNPYKLIFVFSIPLLIGNILQQFYNMVDSIVVGNIVGAKALAAVGTGFPGNIYAQFTVYGNRQWSDGYGVPVFRR